MMKRTLILATASALLLAGCGDKSQAEPSAPAATSTATDSTVPNVIGMSSRDAETALFKSKITIVREPSDVSISEIDLPEWSAASQSVEAGETVEPWSEIVVTFEREGGNPAPSTEPTEGTTAAPAASLEAEAEAAMRSSYGWPDEPHYASITGFSGTDAPRLTVVTSLANKSENEEAARGLCMTLISVRDQITSPFSGVYVTAGEGGPFLAECDNPDY